MRQASCQAPHDKRRETRHEAAAYFRRAASLETLAQAEAENLRRIDALTDRAPDIAAALETCRRNGRCSLVICAVRSRDHRKPDVTRVARHREGNSRPAQDRDDLS